MFEHMLYEDKSDIPAESAGNVDIQKIKKMQNACREISETIDSRLIERFEASGKENETLQFHNQKHTRDVVARVERLIEAMRAGGVEISDHDMEVAKLAAKAHDLVQKWEEKRIPAIEVGLERVMRRRFIGDNERESADELIALMEETNKKANAEIFTEQDKGKIRAALDATIPEFNMELRTVVQPNLDRSSTPITRALALADLGTAGMDGAKQYITEGDALFVEENLDMHGLSLAELRANADFYKSRMMGWVNFQTQFAEGRKNRLEEELAGLNEEARERVRSLFDKFDESIAEAKANAKRRADLSVEELYEELGFKLKQEKAD